MFSVETGTQAGNRWIHLRTVMSELMWISRYNDIVRETRLYYPTLGFSVSNLSYSAIDRAQVPVPENYALLHAEEGTLVLTTTYPTTYSSDSDILILQTSAMPLDALLDMVEDKVFAGQCMLYLGGKCIAGSDEAMAYYGEEMPSGGQRITMGGQNWQTLTRSGARFGVTLVNLIPSETLDAKTSYLNILLIAYAGLSILVVIVFASVLGRSVHIPIRRLSEGFKRVRWGDLDVKIETSGPGEFRSLTEDFNLMVQSLNDAVQTIYKQEVYAKQIELKQLQAQINPHFLYNTFFMLERLINDEEYEASRATCGYLGEYFRYITYTESQMAPLKDEYAHAMNYLRLQEMRYEGRLLLEAGPLPEELAESPVPRLIFQPVLENAFSHGFRQNSGAMRLRIRIEEERGDIRAVFENSASQPPEEALALDLSAKTPTRETTGLLNIHKRIHLTFGESYGVFLSQSELGGLKVTIRFPRKREVHDGDL